MPEHPQPRQAVPQTITSRDNPWLVAVRKSLRDPAAYRNGAPLWLEGAHLCQACVAQGLPVHHALLTATAWEQPELRALAQHAQKISIISDKLMQSLSTLESATTVGFIVPMPQQSLPQPLIPTVVLDRLQDPGNVGTLLRSAAAFGFHQVLALKGTIALWSPKVLRAAMGAHFSLHLCEQQDPQSLQALRVPCLASSPHAQQALHDIPLPWPCAWVLGHEGQGVAPEVMQHCTQQLRIAQPGGQESLNVAVAGAVCLYESVRQRAL